MRTAPVSFGSLQVFTIKDGRPKASVSDMVRIAFFNNPDLSKFHIRDTFYYEKDKQDATVDNAMQSFAEILDEKFRKDFIKSPDAAFLTVTEFYTNPHDKEKRFFVTAASEKDELRILEVLGKGLNFFTAKFRPKF